MTIRALIDTDAPAFHRIRRRALQEEPEAWWLTVFSYARRLPASDPTSPPWEASM